MTGSLEATVGSERGSAPRLTTVYKVNPLHVGGAYIGCDEFILRDDWHAHFDKSTPHAKILLQAAQELRTHDVPVAFPTETVYGLGADATRSSAVQGIYTAKNRPSDNPLIVHVASLDQLRNLLRPRSKCQDGNQDGDCLLRTANAPSDQNDPIPVIYRPLIERFWPGPLTMIMPNTESSVLAPEVTAGLSTFGVRMPKSLLALLLIKLADRPLAAPSANASTKPSPTSAQHVKDDLNGRIETILDGGPCTVGVESTVVDGLSNPPLILRPGGISIEELRSCPGWEQVKVGYKDVSEIGSKPRAPGMKYKHYSPRAVVMLYENPSQAPKLQNLDGHSLPNGRLGIIRTKLWPSVSTSWSDATADVHKNGTSESTKSEHEFSESTSLATKFTVRLPTQTLDVWEIDLGPNIDNVARGLFAGLRELDLQEVDAILVEGIDEDAGDTAAAVMNRLRKAAEVHISE